MKLSPVLVLIGVVSASASNAGTPILTACEGNCTSCVDGIGGIADFCKGLPVGQQQTQCHNALQATLNYCNYGCSGGKK